MLLPFPQKIIFEIKTTALSRKLRILEITILLNDISLAFNWHCEQEKVFRCPFWSILGFFFWRFNLFQSEVSSQSGTTLVTHQCWTKEWMNAGWCIFEWMHLHEWTLLFGFIIHSRVAFFDVVVVHLSSFYRDWMQKILLFMPTQVFDSAINLFPLSSFLPFFSFEWPDDFLLNDNRRC